MTADQPTIADEVEFGDDGYPEPQVEPLKSYPFSSKSKNSAPLDTPHLKHITHPFKAPLEHKLPFNRSEERVNKNPNAKQTFVRRAFETRSAPQEARSAPEEGPQAPPKVPGQPKVEVQPEVKDPSAMKGKGQMFFPEFLTKVKQAFPEIKETFTHPPTYIWNPKDGDEEKIDVKKIKDSLRMKFPKLVWTSSADSAETAQVDFPDLTYALIAIGDQDANHLTVTYHIEGKG